MWTSKNGSTYFYQWDKGQCIIVDNLEADTEVHLTTLDIDVSYKSKVEIIDGQKSVKIPNYLLQESGVLIAYTYIGNEEEGYTKEEHRFVINEKKKPEDYIWTEEGIIKLSKLKEEIDDIEERIDKFGNAPLSMTYDGGAIKFNA